MKAGVLAVIALGAIVWGFALIGIFSVAQAIGPAPASAPALLLEPDENADAALTLDLVQILGLPEFPGATPSEYRQEDIGVEQVTEVEYVVHSSASQVRGHYRESFARGGWSVTASTWVGGEWSYAVRLGTRHGVVEIERQNGVTEVSIDMAEPSAPRGSLSDR